MMTLSPVWTLKSFLPPIFTHLSPPVGIFHERILSAHARPAASHTEWLIHSPLTDNRCTKWSPEFILANNTSAAIELTNALASGAQDKSVQDYRVTLLEDFRGPLSASI